MPRVAPPGAGVRARLGPERVPVFSGSSAAGPTTYNQSLTGALTFSGAVAKQESRPLSGALSFSGALKRTNNHGLTGALSFAGSVARSDARLLAGALTFAGSVSKREARSLAGSFTPTGVLASSKAFLRTVTGALSFSGSVKRSTIRRVTAAITPTGVVSGVRSIARTVTGALSFRAGNALAPDPILYPDPALYPYAGSLLIQRPKHLDASALTFIGGQQLYPQDALYPSDAEFPFGGAVIFQLNRLLPGVLRPGGVLATQGGLVRVFTATLHPTAVFVKATTRHLTISATLLTVSFSAQRLSHNVLQALFASFRAAGAMSTIVNASTVPPGGGGWGTPMPDSHFTRYKPTLRRQRMKV
jgi:hypothetical protein